MQDLMSTAPCGYVAFADDGTIVEMNRTACDMLGYARVEILGWHIDKFLPPGGRIFFHTYLFPMLKVQGKAEEIYVALRVKGGEDVPVLLNGVRRERDDRFVSECVFVKMVQRHEFEQQLLEARQLAERSNAAKARFLSMMSHDLRTPLTTISGNTQLLATEDLPPDARAAVDEIREACRLQTKLIDDILEFARIDSGRVEVKPRTVPAREVVDRALALVRLQAADAGLTLRKQLDESVEVSADPDRLQQILLNLLTNALKFTPPGGEISVTCEREGERALIHVRDDGIGIDAQDHDRIFEPFVQVHAGAEPASARGVGLGLAISRDLARAMGGEVSAQSSPGAGSTFTIELPLATSAEEALAGNGA